MSQLTLVLLIVGAIVFIFSAVAAVRAHLQKRDEEMAPSGITSEPNTTAPSSGRAPGATARTPLTLELALTSST